MLKWEDKTNTFTESRRHWNGRYLLQCEVALGEIEVNIYSSPNLWEVFIQFGKITGVSYAEEENIYTLRDNIKEDIEKIYSKYKFNIPGNIINEFCEKYNLDILNSFFDFSSFF